VAVGLPTSATFTWMVAVHGFVADGAAGQLIEPCSALPPRLVSG
jgi:hypothetical protein